MIPDSTMNGSRTLSARLVDVVLRRIRDERLSPGDFLGTEQDLAAQYDVSRTVVREAIGTLRGLGIVSSRQRQGIVVAEPDIQPVLSKVLSHSAIGDDGWRQLAIFRVVVELGSIVLAARNATDEQIARMQALATEMRDMLEQAQLTPVDADELKHAFIEKDMQFHDTLLQAADNALALQFHGLLVDYFSKGEHVLAPPTPIMAEDHLDVVQAIQRRDVFAASRAMDAHMLPILEMLDSRSEFPSTSEAPDLTLKPGPNSVPDFERTKP